MINNLLLATAAATVLFGTLYPLFLEAITGEKISVGPPFFNASFNPISLGLVVVMGIGPFLSWKRADLGAVLSRLTWVGILALIAGGIAWYLRTGGPLLAVFAIACAIWLMFATLAEFAYRIKLGKSSFTESLRRASNLPRSTLGMTVAHFGLSVCILGFVGSSAWKEEVVTFIEPGTVVEIAGFDVTFEGVKRVQGPNYLSDTGTLKVERDGAFIETLSPERRHYPVAGTSTTESDIRQTFAGDLYASIVEPSNPEARGKWTLRIIYEPLVNFIWGGAILLILGGFLSLSDRRLRVGAPKRTSTIQVVPAE